MESFPFRLLLTMVLVSFALQFGLSALDALTHSIGMRQLADSAVDVVGTIDLLKAGDHGSFDFVEVHVPTGSYMRIENSTDEILTPGHNYSLPCDVQNSLYLEPGDYELRLYYGVAGGELTLSFI